MAALPFHYFLALREDWITSNTVRTADDDDSGGGSGGEFNFNAQSLKGEMA